MPSKQLKKPSVVIVGSGLMGRGIGQSFAAGGHYVTLVDLNERILRDSIKLVGESLSTMEAKGLLKEPREKVIGRISLETDPSKALQDAGFVVEAIVEDLNEKKKLFATMDAESDPTTILASNTSGLPITSIASVSRNPARIVGTHFWNPPHLMRAVEVVRGERTSSETLRRTVEVLRGIGKKPAIVLKDVPGQIGIRILYAMIREATWLVENGVASPKDVDTVVKEALGTRLGVLGPLELADLSGVDLVERVARAVYRSLDSSKGPQKLINEMVARGKTGAKAGKGFYDWKGKGGMSLAEATKIRDEYLMEIIRRETRRSDSP